MDKKIIILTNLISFGIGLFVMYILCPERKISQNNRNNTSIYNYLGHDIDTSYHGKLPIDGIYTHNLIPDDVKEHGVIPNAETAAKVTSALIPRIYDEDCLKKEMPFQIKLINNEIWSIRGSLPQNALGGTFCLMLDKKTGGMIMVSHGK